MKPLVVRSCCLSLSLGLACGTDTPTQAADGGSEGTPTEPGTESDADADAGDAGRTTGGDATLTRGTDDPTTSGKASTDDDAATTAVDTEADRDTTGGDETSGGEEQPEPELLRFIAMGDAGEGNAAQYDVAAAIEQVCGDKGGCEFVLYLGDNFYDDGVSSVDDDQFQTKFEQPYADLFMPFWVAMGNHDYGELSFLWGKLEYEVEYTNYSEKWNMIDKWYTVEQYPNVDIFVMDTTRLMWNHEKSAQRDWLDAAIAASDQPWKIAIGHHPYLSNGRHGNAGNYEGWSFPSQVAGTHVKDVMDTSLCGKVDLYLAGHDHNRQWLEGTCGNAPTTHFIVSGAGCKTTGFEYHDGGNPVYWEDDSTPGFLLLELTPTKIHGEFYDRDGNLEFQHEITK